jgi:hypothetical protein
MGSMSPSGSLADFQKAHRRQNRELRQVIRAAGIKAGRFVTFLSQLLFVIGNAATLITDAYLEGQLYSWLDRTGFWEYVLQNGYFSVRDIADCIVGF